MRTGGGELLGHKLVDGLYKRFWKVPAAHAGLVRDNDHGKSRIVQTLDGFRDARQDSKTTNVIQIANFFTYRAVAIEKNGWAQRVRFRQGAPPARKSNVARRIRPRRA
jgi:translation initiation factor 2 gamma subunit (eIF-2gamma)